MFLVVFRNRKRADLDEAAYGDDAARMLALAEVQPGFVSFKSYTADDGEVIALSEWASAETAQAWGRHPDHAPVQGRGRAGYYQDYTLFACDNPRVHHFESSQT
jgi:heme-degrading monooxygenase HmoA